MKKSRLMLALAGGVVLAGMSTGILAYLSAPGANARASRLPEPAIWMPASASFIAYIDVASLLASPLSDAWVARQETLQETEKFRQATGMDPWNDFRALSISSRPGESGKLWGIALTGELDPEKLVSVMEEHRKLERSTYRDTTLYTFSTETREDGESHVLAFPGPATALFGSPEQVRTMLDVGAGREAAAADGPLGRWLLSDPEAALKLAEVVRGFVALGSLQHQARPEVRAVLDSMQIEAFENRVEVSLSVPCETIGRLSQAKEENN
jgi:hypothetical protein